jgi:putative transposase
MENVAIKYPDCQENTSDTIFETTDKSIPSGEQFFDMLEQQLRDIARITIINTINDEFETFIGVAPYQRSDDRTDSRNGFRYRNFETRFGVIKDIPIPRSRTGRFIPKLFNRWIRRENKITRAIADMFVNGISTPKVKKITKAIWGRNYSATTVSRCNQVLKEDYLKWMNRPISQSIRYLFLDAVNLKVRRHWISK